MQDKINQFNSLKSEWKLFQSKNKKIRIRDAADQIGVSEAQLLSTEIGDDTLYLSINDFSFFLKEVFSIDKLMLLIRSDIVVHEKTIKSRNIKFIKNQILDKNNDLILDFDQSLFKYVFFQNKVHANRQLRSFQIFNFEGKAVLKIYLKGKESSNFDRIAKKYTSDYNYQLQSPIKAVSSIGESQKIDAYFFDKNTEFRNSEISTKSLRIILTKASDMRLPIQIHGLGLGTVQYHRDKVRNIVDYGPWINVIDRNFNLHVLESELYKSVLSVCDKGNQKYCIVNFFNKNNEHILGITSIKGLEDNFFSIIDNIEEN